MMSFQFAAPWVLSLVLIIPGLLAAYHLLSKRRNDPATMHHAAAGLVRDLPRSWRIAWRPILAVLRLAAVALMIIALARPQFVQGKETITGEGVDIALALDISGSMASLDFEPKNRLEAAKAVIADFVMERPYDKIGMVIFASEAFSQSPLTLDHNMVTRSLDQVRLASDLGIDDGTAIGLGIANAANMLTNSDAESKVVILLTDGVNNSGQIDPLTAAEAAKALGIKIYTIGAGRPGEVPVPVPSMLGGTTVTYQESVLDEATLQQVAEITGGQYFRAQDTAGLKAIYDEINKLEKSQVEIQVFNQYQELMIWVLLPALALLLVEIVLRNTLFRKVP
ncbi:MAG: VWA domain-containing protein [Candidatus Promineifilaceae bacterium]|nr:VWA domain-containing protein [Candidatus Promineifilaceae bacterium]